MRIYYSQNKEDLLIKSFFPDVKKGVYVDVGANDPVIDSVTKLFYDEGWHGINIDPIHKHIVDLEKARPRDINLELGVGSKQGEQKFTEYPMGDGLSTFADSMRDVYKKTSRHPNSKPKNYTVPVKTLNTIIKENDIGHINFMKIDVEGYEYEVIAGYDWKHPRPELICIEAVHIFQDWQPLLESKDYKLVFFDGVNNYYLAKESLKRQNHFNYADAVLAGPPVYYLAYEEMKKSAMNEFKYKENLLLQKLKDKEQEVSFMQSQQRDLHFLAKRLSSEIEIRLNRRANAHKPKSTLSYHEDSTINELNKTDHVELKDIRASVKSRDKQNVKSTNNISGYPKLVFWKLTSKVYSIGLRLIKKTRTV